MGKWFTYHLVLVSVGSPSGLAVYHYFINKPSDQTQQAQDCCCKEAGGSCSTPCAQVCSSK